MVSYDADDRTSLSFHEGDVIQVITQLESGWWDGVINGVRGWFPSNYCQIITSPDELPDQPQGVDVLDNFDEKAEVNKSAVGHCKCCAARLSSLSTTAESL